MKLANDQSAEATTSPTLCQSPCTTGGIDAEVDADVMKSVPPKFTVDSAEAANWLIKKVIAARAYSVRVKEWAANERRRAEREEATLLFLFGRQIEAWTRLEIEKLGGRRKSIALPAGTVGFRANTLTLQIDDEASVLEWASKRCPEAVSIVKRISLLAVRAHFEQTGEMPDNGAHIQPAHESFSIR